MLVTSDELAKALGLPKHTMNASIVMKPGEFAVIRCEIGLSKEQFNTVVEEFKLQRKEKTDARPE